MNINEIFKNATQKIIDKKRVMEASYGSDLIVRLEEKPVNPRDFASEESVMLCLHSRHTLGDRQSFDYLKSSEDVSGWETMKEVIMKDETPVSILPLFLLDHSGLTISTSPFSCPWDSGQIGFIYSDSLCEEELEHQVQDYNRFINGDSWEWIRVEYNGSCGGYESESAARQGGEAFLKDTAERDDYCAKSMVDARTAIDSGEYNNVFINVETLLANKTASITSIAEPDVYVDLWTVEDIANNSETSLEKALEIIKVLNDGDGFGYEFIEEVADRYLKDH